MSNNAPQASPTIQELLDEILRMLYTLSSSNDNLKTHGARTMEEWFANRDADLLQTRKAVIELFSHIITEARPEKKHYGDTCTPTHCFCMYTPRNDAIDEYERNLRVAISKEIKK